MPTAYLDTSSLAPLFLPDERAGEIRVLVETAAALATSALARIEMHRVLHIRRAHRLISAGQYTRLQAAFDDWIGRRVIVDVEPDVVAASIRLISVSNLGVHDAVHLASALYLRDVVHTDVVFVTRDRRLAEAAAAEGLDVLS